MKSALRLRGTGQGSRDSTILPSIDRPVPLSRKRRQRPTHTRIKLDSGVLVAVSVVILLSLLAIYKVFSRVGVQPDYDPSVPLAPAFPSFDSPAFRKRCPWIFSSKNEQSEGSVYVTMLPDSNEGIAQWVSGIGTGYLLAELLHSKLLIDFGHSVDVHQIMEPVRNDRNWSLPADFDCQEANCRKIYGISAEANSYSFTNQALPKVPAYRHASKRSSKTHSLRENDFDPLREFVPGYRLADGFACAFQSLVRLSPTNSVQYQPELFSKLLPALSNPSALVLSLYVRTGYTDKIVEAEKLGSPLPDPGVGSGRPSKAVADCALELENSREEGSDDIVWMVISDSPSVKEWMVTTYTTETRQVLTTNAKGKHTRPGSHPDTDVFAEAFLDWYLIGESNAVITNNQWYSFGFMGAARTSRPMYEGISRQDAKCSRVKWIN